MLHVDIDSFIGGFMNTIIIAITTYALIRNLILILILYTCIETIVVIEILMLCRIKLLQRAVEFLTKTSNILSKRLEFSLFLCTMNCFTTFIKSFLLSRKTFVLRIKELIKYIRIILHFFPSLSINSISKFQ